MDQDGSAGGINICGVEGDYNSFQIDGNGLPSPGGGRGINTRQFAAGGITRIEVIKAPTPDRDADAIGGIINVASRSAFQRSDREFEFDAAGVYSDLPEKWGHAFDLKYSDIFSIGGGAGVADRRHHDAIHRRRYAGGQLRPLERSGEMGRDLPARLIAPAGRTAR